LPFLRQHPILWISRHAPKHPLEICFLLLHTFSEYVIRLLETQIYCCKAISVIDVIVTLCRVTILVPICRHTSYIGRNVQMTATDHNAKYGNEFESIK